MAKLPGDMAREMASVPLASEKTTTVDTVVASGGSMIAPLLAVLGHPSYVMGDGKEYPRTTGFGRDRKPHPDGGTNATVAFITFMPYKGLGITHEGRIYCERFVENGRNKRVYSISLPFLKAERRDAVSRDAIEAFKIHLRDRYRSWQTDQEKAGIKPTARKAARADTWSEDDEPTETASK